jgi:hypothetical protein
MGETMTAAMHETRRKRASRRRARAKARAGRRIPKLKKLIGEATLNAALRNAARAIEWLTPRLRKRTYLDLRYEHRITDVVCWLTACADAHAAHIKKLAQRLRRRR